MWTKSGIESEGQYAFSCELLRTLRFIYEVQVSDQHPWRKTIDTILKSFLQDFRSINRPKEAEILFGLLRGCDFNGLAPFMTAVTSNKEKIQIIGFVNRDWLRRSPSDSQENQKVYEDFCQKDLKVLGILYNDKHKEKCEYQLYDPNDIRLVNDTAPTHQSSNLFKHQFSITSDILDRLFEDSDLLSSIDEDDIGQRQLDIFQLNTRTMIMKMINYQLQSNSQNFLQQLKGSNFYQSLLKFVCKESSIEMKGDIMLLEWLEQRCFAIRKYACENQQSLVKQREVHITLVKDKIYVSFQHPTLKGEKQLNGIQLKSAINYKNFEEKKEVKLVHAQDVFIAQGDDSAKAEKQIVLIDPESLQRSNGLDIVNACQGAITYGVDLNKTIKNIFIKQRENRDKYLELASKTIFLVTEEDYKKIVHLAQSNTFKRSATMKQPSQTQEQANDDEDNFDQIFAKELVDYGGFKPQIAKKTLDKEKVESKTETLVQLCKQIKDGAIDLDDHAEVQQEDQVVEEQPNEEQKDKYQGKKFVEEQSESLSYLKTSFQQYIERQHSDRQERSTKDALFDAINSFSKKELAADYEKSLIRLFNMYCRHVFWSLIQKDDIERIFSMVLENQNEMRSFSVFLKVLGNECFITGNKVYIKGYKQFLKKVVHICCKSDKFRPLLTILIEEGIINAYQLHMDEIKTDTVGYSNKRIEEQFKTETKASQLINPFIIVPLLQQVISEDFSVIENNVDRLVSTLVSINCLFIGNFKLKDKTWVLIISILDKVLQRMKTGQINQDIVKRLLKLRIIDYLFGNFEDQKHYEREEAEYVKRMLKDNSSSSELDGISRRDVERLVYAKRATCIQHYLRYHNKELQQILIEMLYKFYQIDKQFSESRFAYKNKQNISNLISYSLMTHIDVYGKILEEGKESKFNEYLLFYNKLEDAQRIITQNIETNHKELEGSFTYKIKNPGSTKQLVRVNDKSSLRLSSAVLFSTDREGTNVEGLFFENQIKKEQALKNIYSDTVYMHYPVYPNCIYVMSLNEENPTPQLIDLPIYQLLERFEEQSYGRFYVTKGNKVYIWKNEELRRYRDHLDIQQFTFGKKCRVMLLKNGKVIAEGRNQGRHFVDSEAEVNDVKYGEIPFYEKKDKIIQISTFLHITIAVTEKGKVFATGDKLAKLALIENSKFGFYELPLYSKDGELEQGELPKEEPVDEQKEQPKEQVEKKDEAKEEKKEEQPPEQVKEEAPKPEAIEEANPPLPEGDLPLVKEKEEEASKVIPEEPSNVGVVQYNQVIQWQIPEPPKQEEPAKEENDVQAIYNVAESQIVAENNEQKEQEAFDQIAKEEEKQVQLDEVQIQVVEQVAEEVPQQVEEVQPPQAEQEQAPSIVEAQQEEVKQEEEKAEEAPKDQAEEEQKEVQESEQINTEVVVEGEPQLHALRVFAGKAANTADQIFIVVVENLKTQKLEIRTMGNSSYGQLGQGKDIKQSTVFKKIHSRIEIKSPTDLVVGYDHVLVITKNDKLYGWGCYTHDDKQHFSPIHIPFFDSYNIHKLASSQRTTALVSLKTEPSKKLIIVGKFSPMTNGSTSYKTYDLFQNFNIYNVQPYGDKIYVSIQGNYQFRKPVPNPYEHEKQCEQCQEPRIKGLLHFYKDPESNTFHYLCQQCIQNLDEKYQDPNIVMFAIKRPIKDLETKEWPTYDQSAILDEEQRGVVSYQYYTNYKVNGKECDHHYTSVQDLIEPLPQDVNPIIYVRFSRPLKPETKLEPINLTAFYEQTNNYGLSINVTPDYGYSVQNVAQEQIIAKNQSIYDTVAKAFQEVEALESPELQKEFKAKIEEYVSKKLKDQTINDIKYQDLKVGDELKFNSDKLNELSEDCKKYSVGKFIQYLQYVWGAFSYISRSPSSTQDLSLLNIYNQNRSKIPLLLKNKLLKKYLENLSTDDQSVSIHVNRKKAQEFFDTGKVDEKGDFTVFAQVQKGLVQRRYEGMRINQSDKKAWFVKFIGEFALDQGGLFRESLTELCHELQSHVLNLLIPTQNQKNNHGENREKWTINPAAQTPTQMQMYEFLGALIGMSVRSGILMSLNLPSFVWKQLTDEELTLRDLNAIDSMTVTILETLKEIAKGDQMDEETFQQGYELQFTTILSNGEEVELVPHGKTIKVNFSNLKEYIQRTIEVRLSECKKQIKAIKKGINHTFQASFLRMLSWQDLEYKVVGKEILDLERLKEITVYRNCSETSDTIKKYWKIMNSFSNEERMLYLKFVWGRTRLPLKEEEVTENHTIQMDESADVAKLPVGRTCFFRLEIPPYKSEDTFKDKLLYAIRFCTAIDADIENAVQDDGGDTHNLGQFTEERQHREEVESEQQDNNEEEGNDANEGLFGDDY